MDFLRGIAIIMMIVFHIIDDINFFMWNTFNTSSGFWYYLARLTVMIFLLLVGISLTLSFSRNKNAPWMKYLKRGLKIFSWGLLITLMTWIFFRRGFVMFGVLHMIGVSIILAYPFLKLKYWNLGIGAVFVIAGILLKNLVFGFSWLVWLGLKPTTFYTVDYIPILPWFGVVLIGIFLGNWLYSGYKRQFSLPDLSKNPIVKVFCWLGQKSLIIYLIHQPLLIGVLYLLL